jgi:hypothetical protein
MDMESKKQINKQKKSIMSVDLVLLVIKMKELDDRQLGIENKIHSLCKLNLVGCFIFKKISNKRKIELEKETCSICLEQHRINDTLITKCKHYFGECCFGKYVENKLNNNMSVCCPLCRDNNILPVIKCY